MYSVDTANSQYKTVTGTAQNAATGLETTKNYVFVSTVTCWIAQGSSPTASAAAGSKFCAAGEAVVLDGGYGAVLSVIREGGVSGACSVTPITKVR